MRRDTLYLIAAVLVILTCIVLLLNLVDISLSPRLTANDVAHDCLRRIEGFSQLRVS